MQKAIIAVIIIGILLVGWLINKPLPSAERHPRATAQNENAIEKAASTLAILVIGLIDEGANRLQGPSTQPPQPNTHILNPAPIQDPQVHHEQQEGHAQLPLEHTPPYKGRK